MSKGTTKLSIHDPDVNYLAKVAKVFSHPARIAIIKYISCCESGCICNDIVDELPLAQPTISRHLSELKRVGLIKGNIEGKNICYCINEKSWLNVVEKINSISTAINNSSCC